jgi:hypothetical protein
LFFVFVSVVFGSYFPYTHNSHDSFFLFFVFVSVVFDSYFACFVCPYMVKMIGDDDDDNDDENDLLFTRESLDEGDMVGLYAGFHSYCPAVLPPSMSCSSSLSLLHARYVDLVLNGTITSSPSLLYGTPENIGIHTNLEPFDDEGDGCGCACYIRLSLSLSLSVDLI